MYIGRQRTIRPANDHSFPDVFATSNDTASLPPSVLFEQYDGAVGKKCVFDGVAWIPRFPVVYPDATVSECP
jgi:hypothetical protein